MIYVLDTDTCVACLRRPAGQAARKLASVSPPDVAITAVTIAELYRGAQLSVKVAENLVQVSTFVGRFTPLPLEERAAEVAGRIDADLSRQGLRIGPYDTLIAAIALAAGLTLVTHNTREFGLSVLKTYRRHPNVRYNLRYRASAQGSRRDAEEAH